MLFAFIVTVLKYFLFACLFFLSKKKVSHIFASQTMFDVSHQQEPAQIEPIHASVSQSDMFTLSHIKPLLDLFPSRS